MLKKLFNFDSEYAFLLFTSFLVGLFFLIGGVKFISALLTAIFFYIFLRFCHFLWRIFKKIINLTIGGHPDV